jgi:hypothetical protein
LDSLTESTDNVIKVSSYVPNPSEYAAKSLVSLTESSVNAKYSDEYVTQAEDYTTKSSAVVPEAEGFVTKAEECNTDANKRNTTPNDSPFHPLNFLSRECILIPASNLSEVDLDGQSAIFDLFAGKNIQLKRI